MIIYRGNRLMQSSMNNAFVQILYSGIAGTGQFIATRSLNMLYRKLKRAMI